MLLFSKVSSYYFLKNQKNSYIHIYIYLYTYIYIYYLLDIRHCALEARSGVTNAPVLSLDVPLVVSCRFPRGVGRWI